MLHLEFYLKCKIGLKGIMAEFMQKSYLVFVRLLMDSHLNFDRILTN